MGQGQDFQLLEFFHQERRRKSKQHSGRKGAAIEEEKKEHAQEEPEKPLDCYKPGYPPDARMNDSEKQVVDLDEMPMLKWKEESKETAA